MASASVMAASNSNNISMSFAAKEDLKTGSIVSLERAGGETIVSANPNNAERILGVVVDVDKSLVAVDPESNKEQVATTGNASVLVSTVNGGINKGDLVTASPFNGIGMKAVGPGYVLGTALEGFTPASKAAVKQQVQNKNGETSEIAVGYIQVDLSPRYAGEAGAELNGAQQWVRSLTGRTVSMTRVIISLIIAVATIIAVVVLVYASIFGSIISIGRNPLAKQSIFQALSRVLAMALLLVAVAFLLIIMLLR